MSIIIALIITLAAILVIALIALGVKQRKEKRADARHSEAEQMRPKNEPLAPSARASQPNNTRWQPQRNAPPRKTSMPARMRSTPTSNNNESIRHDDPDAPITNAGPPRALQKWMKHEQATATQGGGDGKT
jgi:hypothetical protein